MASQYCYGTEMKQALERHERKEANVIPILLRPVLYTDAPFAKLKMLPTNEKPVMLWRDRDSAFLDIARGIESVAQEYLPAPVLPPPDLSSDSWLLDRPSPYFQGFSCLIWVGAFVVGLIVTGILALFQRSTCISFVIYLFVFILGFLLLLTGFVAVRTVIAINHEKCEQRRAQEVCETARKRRYYEEAIEAYRLALSNNPSDEDAYKGMGSAQYALELYDQALDAFTKAIDCDSSPAAYAGLGDVFAKLERYSEAVEAYEKALELDPTVALNYDDFIRTLRELGRKEEAEQVHAKAKQLGYEDEEG